LLVDAAAHVVVVVVDDGDDDLREATATDAADVVVIDDFWGSSRPIVVVGLPRERIEGSDRPPLVRRRRIVPHDLPIP
jgi:hypothetical protein